MIQESYWHFINQLTVNIDTSCDFERATFCCTRKFGIKIQKGIQSSQLLNIFSSRMATLRNKRMLAAFARETQKEHPMKGQSRNTSLPGMTEEYIRLVSEEIEGRVTKKLPQEFSRVESRI